MAVLWRLVSLIENSVLLFKVLTSVPNHINNNSNNYFDKSIIIDITSFNRRIRFENQMLGLKVDSMLEQCVLPIVHKYTDNNKWKILKVLKLNPLANMEED